MSWNDYARRRAAIDAVLAYAAEHPEVELPFAEVPGVTAIFNGPRELVLALRHIWQLRLFSRIELLTLESVAGGLREVKDLAQRAWDDCAGSQPVLRRVLDSTAAQYAVQGLRALDGVA